MKSKFDSFTFMNSWKRMAKPKSFRVLNTWLNVKVQVWVLGFWQSLGLVYCKHRLGLGLNQITASHASRSAWLAVIWLSSLVKPNKIGIAEIQDCCPENFSEVLNFSGNWEVSGVDKKGFRVFLEVESQKCCWGRCRVQFFHHFVFKVQVGIAQILHLWKKFWSCLKHANCCHSKCYPMVHVILRHEVSRCYICIAIRGGRSHIFRLRLRSCSKKFESGSGSEIFSILRIRLLFKLRKPPMQPEFSNVLIDQRRL